MANAWGSAVKGESVEVMIRKEYPEQEFNPIPRGIPIIKEYYANVYGGKIEIRVKFMDVEKAWCEEGTNFYWLRQHITYCLAMYNPGIHLLDEERGGCWGEAVLETLAEGTQHFTQISADKFEWTGNCDMVFTPHPTVARLQDAEGVNSTLSVHPSRRKWVTPLSIQKSHNVNQAE